MSVDDTDITQDTARRYFDAWTSRDTATARGLLADDFSFTAGDMSIEGRDAFLDAGAFPKDAETTMVDEVTRADARSRCTTRSAARRSSGSSNTSSWTTAGSRAPLS